VGVIRGMAQTLRSAGPALVIEPHGTQSEVADASDAVGYEHAPINSPAKQARGAPVGSQPGATVRRPRRRAPGRAPARIGGLV
jgi:hypothetical protein